MAVSQPGTELDFGSATKSVIAPLSLRDRSSYLPFIRRGSELHSQGAKWRQLSEGVSIGEKEWRTKTNKPFSQNKLAAQIPKGMKKMLGAKKNSSSNTSIGTQIQACRKKI